MKITVTRPYNGIGDWLFALACVKYVNRQRPDVQVYVDWNHIKVGRLPPLVPGLFRASDAKFIEGVAPDGPVTRDSLVYRTWPPDNYIASTVAHLNVQTGLDIKYEHGVYPHFGVQHSPSPQPYIAMISQGKRRARFAKEWGSPNFGELARRLSQAGYVVAQVGAAGDEKLRFAQHHYLGMPADQLVRVLGRALCYIGIENGVMVLCGYLGVPQITIYDGAIHPGHCSANPSRTSFDNHLKILHRVEPAEVAARVLDYLSSAKEKVAC